MTTAMIPPSLAITRMNRTANGRSASANSAADDIITRTCSSPLSCAAVVPIDGGRASRRTSAVREKKNSETSVSILTASSSSMLARITRSTKSNRIATIAPIDSTHSVEKAPRGTTRS